MPSVNALGHICIKEVSIPSCYGINKSKSLGMIWFLPFIDIKQFSEGYLGG